MLFLDKNHRMNLVVFTYYIIHIVLSFILKDISIARIDLINTTASMLVGILVGRLFLITRLNNFEMERQLIKEKETDFLTGLYNRRKLYDDLNKANISKADISFMILDIDNFKQYNDKYGHLCGDIAIKEFVSILKEVSSKYNINFYRYGGDEFAGISYNLDEKKLLKIANEINQNTKTINSLHQNITTSIGLYLSINKSNELNNILDFADKALYKAKIMGKDKIEIYNNN